MQSLGEASDCRILYSRRKANANETIRILDQVTRKDERRHFSNLRANVTPNIVDYHDYEDLDYRVHQATLDRGLRVVSFSLHCVVR